MCVVLMPLHARIYWVLILHDQTLVNLGLPRTKDGVSAEFTRFLGSRLLIILLFQVEGDVCRAK